MTVERCGSWTQTYTGRKFWALDPRPGDACIEDIAHALSLLCRYNGHSKFFYSVAQHSIHVAKLLKSQGYNSWAQILGLLHDASEAYICDLPRPVKPSIEGYEDLEAKIQNVVLQTLGIAHPGRTYEIAVKKADGMMLTPEGIALMGDLTEWTIPDREWTHSLNGEYYPVIEQAPYDQVEREFLELYNQLKGEYSAWQKSLGAS